jgi:hypothetical protein
VGTDLGVLARYEQALSKLPLEYTFILKGDPVPPGALHVIDTQGAFEEPRFVSDGGKIPDVLKACMPLRLPPGWTASYSRSEDRATLLAYLHDTGERPAGADAKAVLTIQDLPQGPVHVRLYNLVEKTMISEDSNVKAGTITRTIRGPDLFLLIWPEKQAGATPAQFAGRSDRT